VLINFGPQNCGAVSRHDQVRRESKIITIFQWVPILSARSITCTTAPERSEVAQSASLCGGTNEKTDAHSSCRSSAAKVKFFALRVQIEPREAFAPRQLI
jgi:hypothetical protein